MLIDLWAKLDRPRAVYSDLTRVAFVGDDGARRVRGVFDVVAAARDAAIARVKEAFAAGEPLRGWEVDDAARDGDRGGRLRRRFIHRTGHNIGQEVHGNGANMDDLETHEERLVMRRTCFSIEPGIYLREFGVRSEVNVFIDADGQVHVTGGPAQERGRRDPGLILSSWSRHPAVDGSSGPMCAASFPTIERARMSQEDERLRRSPAGVPGTASRRARPTAGPSAGASSRRTDQCKPHEMKLTRLWLMICQGGKRLGRGNERGRRTREERQRSGSF